MALKKAVGGFYFEVDPGQAVDQDRQINFLFLAKLLNREIGFELGTHLAGIPDVVTERV